MKKGRWAGIFFERSRKMAISKDNVKSNFMELSGLVCRAYNGVC